MSDRKLELSFKIQERVLRDTRQELQDMRADLLASQNEVDVLTQKLIVLTEYQDQTVNIVLQQKEKIIEDKMVLIAGLRDKVDVLQSRVQSVSREYNSAYPDRSPILWDESK